MNLPSLSEISSESLTQSLKFLREVQRLDDVHFLWMLAEVDRRKHYLELAYNSVWAFCTSELRLSNGAAGRRIAAARLLGRFPAAADYLADGRLGITTFGMLKDVLTTANHIEVLDAASGKAEPDVDRLVATYVARSHVAERVRSVSPRTVSVQVSTPSAGAELPPRELELVTVVLPTPPARARAVDSQYVELTITVRRQFMDDLAQVTDALSHLVPSGKKEDVLHECIQRTLRESAARRGGLPARTPAPGVNLSTAPSTPAPGVNPSTARPSTPAPGVNLSTAPSTPAPGVNPSTAPRTPAPGVVDTNDFGRRVAAVMERPGSRHVSIHVGRAVWHRDEGCCTFVAENGRRCRSTHQLEFQHRIAFAFGGEATLENLTIHCRAHNQFMEEKDFGEEYVARFRRGA